MKSSLFVKNLKEKKLLLPPLSGYTDYPFRVILSHFRPPFIMTEMANAHAIVQQNKRTMQILKIAEGNQYNGVQLIGNISRYMGKAAEIVEQLGFDFIDINMGCTARKVVRRGEGISLMKHEVQTSEIVTAVVNAVQIPVTCKLRLGASQHSINVVSLSQKLVDAGVSALIIHGRSGEKKFGLPVDRGIIKEVVNAVSIPIVANGGIYTGSDARNILKETGAAAVMPGRGLIGNPWIIPELCNNLSHQRYVQPLTQEKKEICLEHLRLLIDFYGERRGIVKMRNILPHYFSSCVFLKDLKKDVQRVTDKKHIHDLLKRIQNEDTKMVYSK